MKIQIRRMEEKDISQIYEHIHKSYVHKYYPLEETKQWEAHSRWYQFVLHSPSYFFYILELEGEFVGTIRYELEEERAIVSIFLKEEYRGKSYAKEALLESMERLSQEVEVEEIEANILEENETSIRLFTSCNFVKRKKEQYCYSCRKGNED